MPFELESVLRVLREEVAPRAEAIDQDPAALEEALALLGRHEALALRRPHEFGGPALEGPDYARFQEATARASGALAFLQTQHQSAGAMLAACENQALRRAYLPRMGSGARRLGIGFGHLRRPGAPVVTVSEAPGGYRFRGELPWVTGAGFFPEFVGAGLLPDGRAVFAVLPLVEAEGVTLGPPAELAVMQVTRTVTVGLSDAFAPMARVVAVREPGWIHAVDRLSVRSRAHQALGCAQAGLDALERVASRSPGAPAALEALRGELASCRAAVFGGPPSGTSDLEVRAWAIELAARVGLAAVACASGSGVLRDRAPQRVYREALAYTVLGQSAEVRDATLARLAARG